MPRCFAYADFPMKCSIQTIFSYHMHFSVPSAHTWEMSVMQTVLGLKADVSSLVIKDR